MRRACSTRDTLEALLVSIEPLRALYRTMARIRAFEEAAEAASLGGVQAFGAASTCLLYTSPSPRD